MTDGPNASTAPESPGLTRKPISILPLYSILNQIHQTQKMQKIKSVAGKNVREWLNVSNRKCRNVLFLLLFTVVVCGSVYFEFIDKNYRVTNNKESFANVLQPADEFRRVCGVNASQPDIYATDYAKLITSQSRL